MKIAIAASSPKIETEVDMHGARADYYLLYDTDTGSVEAVSNPVAHAQRHAGPEAAAYLVNKGADTVVAGQFGPKFRAELEDSGIVCLEKTGTISEVINQFSTKES